MKFICIDLCSGLGGFSQAFVDAEWDVIRIDVESKFKPSIVADVRFLPLRRDIKPKVVLASPPCNHFSTAALCMGYPRLGIRRALEVVGACLEAIPYLGSEHWMLENPRGMLRTVLGRPRTTLHLSDWGLKFKKPTDLWGNVMLPMVDSVKPYIRARRARPGEGRGGIGRIVSNPAERAKMPYGLSQSLLDAVKQSILTSGA